MPHVVFGVCFRKRSEHEVSETSSERAEREEHERQMELAEELNKHIQEVREQLERDGDFDSDDGWGFDIPMQHAVHSKRSGRSQAFSDSWFMSSFMGSEDLQILQEEVESEKQREKEAVYQAQRQKIFQEKVAGPH